VRFIQLFRQTTKGKKTNQMFSLNAALGVFEAPPPVIKVSTIVIRPRKEFFGQAILIGRYTEKVFFLSDA